MRVHLAVIALLLPAGLWADDARLKEARLRWLKGNYEEARSLYQPLLKTQPVAAGIGISKCHESEGDFEQALAAIDTALKAQPKNADLLARRGELLHLRGRWKEAESAADEALAVNKENMTAHWVKAQVLRDRGELARADAECRWFVRTYNDRDIKDPEELLLVGLAGAENARWHNLADQFSFILNDVYGDALKLDRDYWPAEYQAGLLLLEKYNKPAALAAFEKVLTINPNCAEAFVGKGMAALQDLEVRKAEQFAEQALAINPNHPRALRLRADVHLLAGDLAASRRDLDAARRINPRDEATLGRIAALSWLQRQQVEVDALAKEVLGHNSRPAAFYHELASGLEARRRYEAAQKYYQQAIEYRPQVPWSRNSLGLLLMRLGQEKEARVVLDEAFKADPFNVRVNNTRKVLDHLAQYEDIRTDHFLLRFDPKLDRVLAAYMADQLERIYDELAAKFDYKPTGPILIELFNNHDMFSGRVVHLPDLHTIGACTGRMLAMVSPRGKGMGKPFNWMRVLRHEIVHIFNLEQTGFQCPHWLTEGLAVSYEGFPRPQPWNELLRRRVPAGELFNLDTVDFGFIRPKSPEDWNMAYCQSLLYVQFMEKQYGPASIGGMLAAYRDGLDTASAIQKVCGVDKAAFEKGYRQYLDEVVKGLGSQPARKPLSFTELQTRHEKDPGNTDIAARLAEQLQLRNRNAEARKLVEAILARQPKHSLALQVKARLLRQAGDDDDARKLLQLAAEDPQADPRVLLELGKLHYEAGELDQAAALFERGRRQQPGDSQWLVELARVHTVNKDRAKLIAVLQELAPTDADDLEVRKRLARMLLDDGKLAEAEQAARWALEISVHDALAQDVLLESLEKQGKQAEVQRLRKMLGR